MSFIVRKYIFGGQGNLIVKHSKLKIDILTILRFIETN